MNRTVFLGAFAAASLLASAAVAADVSGSITLTSNYVSRGTAQNLPGGPSLQAYGEISHKGFYASTFAATMDYDEGSTKELDFFVGYRKAVGKFSIDVSAANINYPDNPTALNFIEYGVKVDHPVGKGNVGVWVGYTNHYFNTYGKGTWTEAHASYPLTDKLTINGQVAHQNLPRGWDYSTYGVGASYALGKGYSLGLAWSDTDKPQLDPIYGSYGDQVAVSITKAF
jgi:uncharacterized protein (TIGR02001 family)